MVQTDKRRFMATIIALAMMLSMIPVMPSMTVKAAVDSGVIPMTSSVMAFESGKTYTIENTEQMNRFGTLVRNGKTGDGATFELIADIAFGYWQDINGNSVADDGEIFDSPSGGTAYTNNNYTMVGRAEKLFYGTFDGKGHTISGLYSTSNPLNPDRAMFFCVDGGVVKNLVIANSFINGSRNAAAIVSGLTNNGTVENCRVESSVSVVGGSSLGGVVGFCSSSTVQGCINHGRVGSSGMYIYVGGIVGRADGEGFLVQYCYNTGDISPNSCSFAVGGIVGLMGTNANTTVRNCYNTGRLTGTGSASFGGIVGLSYGLIETCYNEATISTTSSSVGNIVGKRFDNGISKVTGCYYDKDVCSIGGIHTLDEAGNAEGKTTAQMQTETAFSGWDTSVWHFESGKYPQLTALMSDDTDAPEIVGVSRISNTLIAVELSENCCDMTKNNDGGFMVTKTGTSQNYNVTSAVYGDNPRQIVLTVENTGKAGDAGVTVTYTRGTNGTVADRAGNALETDTAGAETGAWDTTSPTLVSASRINDTTILVELSEDCLNLEKTGDGGFTVTKTGDAATTYAVTATAQGADLTHIILTVGSIMTACSDGVTVTYAKGMNGTITDVVDKVLETDSVGVRAAAWDTDVPTLVSASRTSDTRLTVALSEDCLNLMKSNDGGFTVTETNGTVTYAVTSTIEGDDTSHITLFVDDISASRAKGITVTYTAGTNGTITDMVYKALETDTVGVNAPAWDTEGPEVGDVTDWAVYNTSVTPTFTEGSATLSKNGSTENPYTSGTTISDDGSYVLTVTNTLGNSTVVNFIIDTTVPVLSGLELGSVSSSGAVLNFTSNETASYYILIYPAETTAPDADTVLAQGYGAVLRCTGAVCTGANQVNVNGLIAGTDYTAYVILKDAVNYQSVLESVNLTTAGDVIPLTALVETLESGKTYTIENTEQMNRFSTFVQNGETGEGATFELTADITFGYWQDINVNSVTDDGEIFDSPSGGTAYTDNSYKMVGKALKCFSGTFDGRGHTISGLYSSNDSSNTDRALFYCVDGGVVQNLVIANSFINNSGYIAAVASSITNNALVENCRVESSVSIVGESTLGGIVASSDSSTIQACINHGLVKGVGVRVYIGGIVGRADGEGALIQYCYNTCDINVGLWGYVVAGGIVGFLGGNSYATLLNCYNTGGLSGACDNGDFGGIAGVSYGLIENCYNVSTISIVSRYAGNIVGTRAFDGISKVTGCYYDKDVCSIGGIRSSDEAGNAEGKTTAEMQTETAFSGWDTNIWLFESGKYPQLFGFQTFEYSAPTIVGVSRVSDTEIDVELSEDCRYLTRANDGGFMVTEKDDSTKAYTVAATAKGIDATHVVLTVSGLAAAGGKGVTISYTKGTNGVIADLEYTTLKANNIGFSIDAWDTTPPEVANVTDGMSYNTVTPTFTEGTATLSKDSGTAVSYTSGTEISEDGSYELTVTDEAGNATVISFSIDTVEPEVGGIVDGGSYTTVTPTFTEGTATLSKDSGAAQAYTSGTAITEDGSYVLTVTDEAGNSAVISFTIDKIAPIVNNVYASSVTGSGATVNFTLSEVGTCYYFICPISDAAPDAETIRALGIGADAKGTASAIAAANTVDAFGLIAGETYNAYVIVEDVAGNISTVSSTNFTTTADKIELTTEVTTLSSGITYTISNTEELTQLANLVNAGQTGEGATFVLTDNIVFGYWQDKDSDTIMDDGEICDIASGATYTTTNYTMIGDASGNVFSGTFDGKGYTVKGLYNSTPDNTASYSALFASVTNGTIRNVDISESYILGGSSVAALAGDCIGSTVENCWIESSVSIKGLCSNIGGLLGYCDSSIVQYCSNQGNVSGTGEAFIIGGLIGNIAYDYANGKKSLIQYCYNSGNVSGEDGSFGIAYFGGIAGIFYDEGSGNTMRNCYNTGSVSGNAYYIGGIVGEGGGVIESCYNAGSVNGSDFAGGVVGDANSVFGVTMTGCYYDQEICFVAGINGADVIGSAEGRTSTYMKSADFLNLLNNGSSVWKSDSAQINLGYPVFFGMQIAVPMANDVKITGTAEYGETLTGEYTYSDADGDIEGASTYAWYRFDDSIGTNKAAISGASGLTYTLTNDDNGKYISFEVTPIAVKGKNFAAAVGSGLAGPVTKKSQDDLTVEITTTALSPTSTSPIPVTVTFSEDVTGFEQSDVTMGNGTISNFTAVSGTVYTFNIYPTTVGVITVDIAADAASNGNTAATQFSITYNGTCVYYPVIGGNIKFDTATGTVTGYTGSPTTVDIPEQIANVDVTAIAANAFMGCVMFSSVTIPASVTSLGDAAFYSCTSLTAVYFEGNAPTYPTVEGSTGLFTEANASLTVYYRSGKTGFSDTYAGCPTALWDNTISIGSTSATINGMDTGVNIPVSVTFGSPFDSTYTMTRFKTTLTFNNTIFSIDEETLKNNIALATDGLLASLDDVTVTSLVTDGVNTSIDIEYINAAGIAAVNGVMFKFLPTVKSTAIAGDASIALTDMFIDLSKSADTYHLGTTQYPITTVPGMVTVVRNTMSALSIASIENTFICGSLNDINLYTTTDNVVNADINTEITVPFVSLSGTQTDAGEIRAKFTFDPSLMTFAGMEGMDFTAEAVTSAGVQTGEIRIYKDINVSGVYYAEPYEFKLEFTLKSRPADNSATNLNVTEFRVYPLVDGTIADTVYSNLTGTGFTKTINFIDRAEILTNLLSDTVDGTKITEAVEEDSTILYTVKTVNAPNDFTNYSYAWFTNKAGDNYTTPITGADSASYDPARAYIGYRVKANITATSSGALTNSLTSDSVLIQPKLSPSIAFGSLIHADGFASGKTIGYAPNVTYNYTDLSSTTGETYQWSYCDTEDGTYINIDNTTNSLVIGALYMNKWLKLTATATETIGECSKETTDSVKYFLGTPNVTKPEITAVTIVNSDDTAITDTARARDTGTVKANIEVSDTDLILTGYSYQWYRAGAIIEGATGETYLFAKADVGGEITVKAVALSDYYTEAQSDSEQSVAINGYANLSNAPTFEVGTTSVTDNKFVVGNEITIPFTALKYYDLAANNSALITLAYSVTSSSDTNPAATEIDNAIPLNLADMNIKYTITSGDMSNRYLVFKLMARENTIDENIAIGSTVVIIDTYTGEAINWSYTLDYEISDNENFGGYKAWAIMTNVGQDNTLCISIDPSKVVDTKAVIFYSSERGKYVVLMPNDVTPDMDKFTFSTGSTPEIFYGKQENTSANLDVTDVMKPVNVWLKKDVNATSKNMLISEVSGNGEQDVIDATQILKAILEGTTVNEITTDKKTGNFGILSK